MANWCYNFVDFSGDVSKLKIELDELSLKSQEEGQLPDGVDQSRHDVRYMFDICVADDGGWMSFMTKWDHAMGCVLHLANKYDVSFEADYSELGCGVAGIMSYSKEDGITHIEWDGDMSKFTELENGMCEYKGEEFCSLEEAIIYSLKQ